MSETVVITGLMRSGTSLVACILHRLGWFAGAYTSTPMPPSWRSDWEEAHTVDLILEKNPKAAFFKDWIRSKRESAGLFGFSKILLKSPYLALHLHRLLTVARPFVIVTHREQAQVDASMARHPMLSAEDQDDIRDALQRIHPHYVFDTDRCKEDPMTEIQSLCMALGFDPGHDLSEAVALVDNNKAQVL